MSGSWEDALHIETLQMRRTLGDSVAGVLWPCGAPGTPLPEATLLHRLVGVVYRPDSERESHCSATELGNMYDAVLHVGTTTAVVPCH